MYIKYIYSRGMLYCSSLAILKYHECLGTVCIVCVAFRQNGLPIPTKETPSSFNALAAATASEFPGFAVTVGPSDSRTPTKLFAPGLFALYA